MKTETGNLFDAIPADISRELFTELARGDQLRIERIVSKGHTSPESGWYDQDDNEWVVVLAGEANVTFASGDTVHLTAGSYLNIPAHTRHRVSWTLPDRETVWLAVHYR